VEPAFFLNVLPHQRRAGPPRDGQAGLGRQRGTEPVFINAGFRGCAKTTRTKLFLAFCIAKDAEHRHRYIKTLSKDYANARQNVTDLYNLLISPASSTTIRDVQEGAGLVRGR
jgi:hypothetical protein